MSNIVAEAPGYLQVFANGSVKRFSPEIAQASSDSFNGYKSKDVTIDPSKQITARIFLPDTHTTSTKLPILVYFHGGGFCIGSTTWLGYHCFLGDFSVASKSIVLSIDYRLAPENRLPIAYDDCYFSLEWLIQHKNSEPFLAQADCSRVFLSGDSAGGNIAHNVAIKAMKSTTTTTTTKLLDVKIRGLLLIHPYFGSEKRTQREMEDKAAGDVKMNDMFWRLSIPEGFNRDYYGCNFEVEKLSVKEWSTQFPAVVVYVAGLDFLKERGVMYAEFLQKKGVKDVRLVETEGESHVFHVFRPESEATRLLQQQMSEFMKGY